MGINEGFFGNIHHRLNVLKANGQVYQGEPHAFPHTSFVTRGKVKVEHKQPDGAIRKTEIVTAPDFVQIQAEETHTFTALEKNCHWWCIFVVRDIDGQPSNPDIDLSHV